MARVTATFSVSLPPEMATELEQVRREEHRTRSELVREALRRYFAARGEKEKLL
jgi:CopG family transcriptional regulator / antitoxin EndoAI